MGGLAVSPLPSGVPNASMQATKCVPKVYGQIGCVTLAIWGIPNTSKQETKCVPKVYRSLHTLLSSMGLGVCQH